MLFYFVDFIINKKIGKMNTTKKMRVIKDIPSLSGYFKTGDIVTMVTYPYSDFMVITDNGTSVSGEAIKKAIGNKSTDVYFERILKKM